MVFGNIRDRKDYAWLEDVVGKCFDYANTHDLLSFEKGSHTIDGDDLYFVSGNQSILRTRKRDLKILERFPVPAEISGMIQRTHIQDWFYITISTDLTGNQDYATILRVQD